MAISVTRSRVKEKCSISSSSYDSTIDNLIAEIVPAITHAIRDEHIADTGNTNLQATLNLGAAEIVCGELLEQIHREAGAMERVRLGDFEIWPPSPSVWPGALGIKEAGWARLRPFLKADVSGVRAKPVGASGRPAELGQY
jgi:hypothetical protein